MPNRPVKPRSVSPINGKVSGKAANAGNADTNTSNVGKRPGYADSPSSVESLAVTKKGLGRLRKGGRVSAHQGPVAPMRGRKRVRTK